MTGRCVRRSSVGPRFDSVESFFLFLVVFLSLFFFLPPLTPRLCISFFPTFFCPPLISSSSFPQPSFLFFPIHFLSFLLLVSPFLLLFFLSFLPLFYFPDFFFLFLSSLFLIPFAFVFSFSPLNFFLVSPLYQGGCYEHKG